MIGYTWGKIMYYPICAQRLMDLPNSSLREFRDRRLNRFVKKFIKLKISLNSRFNKGIIYLVGGHKMIACLKEMLV